MKRRPVATGKSGSAAVTRSKNSETQPRNSIINPYVDGFCAGGLSLFVAVYVLLFGVLTNASITQVAFAIELYLVTDVLINGPHFMASYRLLYQKRENFRRHPVVTIAMPLIALVFLGYVGFRCFADPLETSQNPMPIIEALNWVAPLFLGWHYMGQSWGMTASFAFLAGFRMTQRERRFIRCGFHALFAFHVALAFDAMGFVQSQFPNIGLGASIMSFALIGTRTAAIVTFLLGLYGFQQMSKREGKPISFRVWIPWAATYSWYVMIDFHPASLFLVQGFHALQYLMFPIRVEMNEYRTESHRWRHLVLYYLVLIALGLLGFHWSDMFGVSDARLPLVTAIAVVLNLHHYFIDGVIWKIRDPEVRKSLFGHLEAAKN